jgi:hypothetical protein
MKSTGERVPGWARLVAAVTGGALAAAGAMAVFVTNNSAGAGSLVVAGAVLAALGMFANRIQTVKGGGLELVLAAVAASTLDAAEEAEQHGQSDVAKALRDQARVLISAVQPFATKYEQMRRDRPSGWDRTIELEHLSAETAKLLAPFYSDRASVEELFDTGTEGNRWGAIILMEHNPKLASPHVVATAVQSPLSRFEVFHALKVIEGMAFVDPLSDDLAALLDVVERELRAGRLGHADSDRRNLAERILARSNRPGGRQDGNHG